VPRFWPFFVILHEARGLDFDAFCDIALTLEIRLEIGGSTCGAVMAWAERQSNILGQVRILSAF